MLPGLKYGSTGEGDWRAGTRELTDMCILAARVAYMSYPTFTYLCAYVRNGMVWCGRVCVGHVLICCWSSLMDVIGGPH
jgi:hypothetical protein